MTGTIIAVVLQIVGFILNRIGASKQMKQDYFDFVKKASKDLGSVRLMQYGDKQLAYLKKTPWKESKK